MIPALININGVWDVLPPGIHDATLSEIENRFATNDMSLIALKEPPMIGLMEPLKRVQNRVSD